MKTDNKWLVIGVAWMLFVSTLAACGIYGAYRVSCLLSRVEMNCYADAHSRYGKPGYMDPATGTKHTRANGVKCQ